jgi:outer membrane protein TolC
MRSAVLASLLMLPVAGLACAVDQQEEVSRYRSLLDMGVLPEAPAAGAPLTIQQALALANQLDERLAIAGENYVQALIARQRAVAQFLPTINLVPTYVFRERSNSGIEFLDDPTQTDVPVSANVNVFRGFSDLAALRGSEATIEQQRELLFDVRESLLLDVARIFFQVLRSERSVAVLASSLASQEERVRDMQARQLAGLARPLDVAQTEAQASETRLDLIAARNDVARARTTLSFLTGVALARTPLTDDYSVPDSAPPEP